MKEKKQCSLDGCSYASAHGQGLDAHERSHIVRGEATRGSDGKLVATGVPIVSRPYDRVKRMQDIRAGIIKVGDESLVAIVDKSSTGLAKSKRKYVKRKYAKRAMALAPIGQQINIPAPHDTAGDVLTRAAVLVRVTEMVMSMPPEDVLQMFSTMRHIKLPR